jgi:hypothetical protein
MPSKLGPAIVVVLLALPVLGHAQASGKSPTAVPDGTTVSPLKYGELETEITLKPEEQVAFLLVNDIWRLESECLDKDMGIGRMCSINELMNGVKTGGGTTIGLTVNPGRSANYRVDLILMGDFCMVRALPNKPNLGAFGVAGSVKRAMGELYYNPNGADLAKAERVTEMGYSGDGFKR